MPLRGGPDSYPLHMTNPSVSTWDVLQSLGFAEDRSERHLGFSLNFGRFKLWALRCTNRWFADIVLVTGVLSDGRNLSEVIKELPAKVESAEQAMAWMAWIVDEETKHLFKLSSEPAWLVEGRRHRDLLPWERERVIWEQEGAAYDARPHCDVRDWMRLALRKLREHVSSVSPEALVTVAFDGTVLEIRCEQMVLAMSASGAPWTKKWGIRAGALQPFPRRLMRDPVDVSVWQATLQIGDQRYAGLVSLEPDQKTL